MRNASIPAVVVCAVASVADAGPMNYGWLPSTDTTPDGGLELQTSIYEHDDLGRYHERTSALLWTPALGVTDTVELAVPVELASRTAVDVAPGVAFTRFGAEVRYRVLPRTSPVAVVARAGLSRDVAIRTQVRSELGVAASYDIDRWQIEGDAGLVDDFNVGHFHDEFRPGLGASARITDRLRVGAEFHAELSFDNVTDSWAVVGPNLAWRRNRYWLAAAVDLGVHAITAAPRLNLGMVW